MTLEEVVVNCQGIEIARHRRFLGKHQTLLAVAHARALRRMREEAETAVAATDTDVEERDLTVYDRLGEVAS